MCFMLSSMHQEDYLTGFSTVNLVPRAFTMGTESPGEEVAQMFLVGRQRRTRAKLILVSLA